MRKFTVSRLFYAGVFMLGFLLGMYHHASASTGSQSLVAPLTATISLNDIGEQNLGDSFKISGYIFDSAVDPIVDKNISFSLNGDYLGQARSDVRGYFELRVNGKFAAGNYTITASFSGSHSFTPATAFTVLKIKPSQVTVQTVPAVEGVTISLDGRQFLTGKDGVASILVSTTGQHHLKVELDKYSNPSQRIGFDRWLDFTIFQPERDITVPFSDTIYVGLDLYYQVSQTFVDLGGVSVDPKRISEITLKSSKGEVFNFSDGQPRWLQVNQITRRRFGGLEAVDLQYSVMTVKIDGQNVVNQAQQRFFPHPNEVWQISLLLYSLHVSTRDALFGSPVGSGITVEFPDGSYENFTLDHSGTAEITSLARGIYHVQVTGVKGLSNQAPVALSRDQVASIKVLTSLDMGVMLGILAVIAIGLLLYGRPWILRLIKEKIQYIPRKMGWNPIHDD
jgi:hypothetical protein